MTLDSGVKPPPKVLEAYVGEGALPTNSTRSILGNLLPFVIVLSWQHYDQLKSGLSWMEVHINHWLPTKGKIPNACIGGFGDHAMNLEVRGIESLPCMCVGCAG